MTAGDQVRFNELCAERSAEGVFSDSDGDYFLSVRPHGIFLRKRDGETGKVSLSFLRKLPKIPQEILEEVVAYFREDLSEEAAVRICFDEGDGSYFFVKAGGARNGTAIYYDYSDSLEDLMRDGVICVMDVHSHNRMNAFWSAVDDGDELTSPGALYGVIGKLDRDRPAMLFRAVDRGVQDGLAAAELFDLEENGVFLEKPEDPTEELERLLFEISECEYSASEEYDDLVCDGKRVCCGAYDLESDEVIETHVVAETGESPRLARLLDVFSRDAREKMERGTCLLFTGIYLVNATEDEYNTLTYEVPNPDGSVDFTAWPGIAREGILSVDSWENPVFFEIFCEGCMKALEGLVYRP